MLKQDIDEATIKYYEGLDSGVSDEEYDSWFKDVYPDSTPLDVYRTLSKNSAGGSKVNLSIPMMSLSKVRMADELCQWGTKMKKSGATKFRLSPKWDGLAVQLVVKHNKLVSATTRGNGEVGEDVTNIVSHISAVLPEGVSSAEVVIPREKFTHIKDKYTTPRNAAAGILMKGAVDYAQYLEMKPHWVDFIHESTFTDIPTVEDITHYNHFVSTFTDIDTDGVVIIAENDEGKLVEVGQTSSTPNYAVAWKFASPQQETVLVRVEWKANRTKLSPVGYFYPPVIFDGVLVSKASLHNIDIINKLDVAIGDTVIVQRSNEVIPHVSHVVSRPVNRHPIIPPEVSSEVTLAHRFKLIVDVFDIKNIGPAIIEGLAEKYKNMSFETTVDLLDFFRYNLSAEGLPRIGEKGISKIKESIDYSINKEGTRSQFFACIGLQGMGRRFFKNILTESLNFDRLLCEQKLELPGVGEIRSQLLFDNSKELLKMWEYTSDMTSTIEQPTGQTVVVTGKLDDVSRKEASKRLTDLGYNVKSSVTKETDILIVGGNIESSKIKKAKEFGVYIEYISSLDEFLNK